jgi:hypothetical protein
MTTDDRLERVLPDVLEHLAPSRAPDRLRDDIVSTTSRMRPRPRWFVSPTHHPRFPTMTPTLRLGILGVLALMLGLVAGPLLLFQGSPGPEPSPSPSPTPRPSPVGPELAHKWLGDPVDIEGWSTGSGISELHLEVPGISYMDPWTPETDNTQGYVAAAGMSPSGQLSFRTVAAVNGRQGTCVLGDAGTYDYAVSTDGQRLTIGGGTDDCAARRQFLVRDWLRADCYTSGDVCLGPIPAGTYSTHFFGTTVETADGYRPRSGVVTYTVPEGWANPVDYPHSLGLSPQATFADCEGVSDVVACMPGGNLPAGIWVFLDPAAVEPTDPCHPAADPSVGFRAQDIVSWMDRLDGVRVLDRRTVKVGDVEGLAIKVGPDPAWTGTCPDYERPGVAMLTERHPHPKAGALYTFDSASYTVDNPASWFVFADVDETHTIGIDVSPATGSRLDAFLEEALPIIGSLTFDLASPS